MSKSPFVSAESFWEGPDEVAWSVEGLIPEASLGVLAGIPKAGKSLLSLNLAISVAMGRPFLRRRCIAGRVGVIQLEDPDVLIRKRLKAMVALPPPNLLLSTGKPWDADLRTLLGAFIIEHDLALVIIDPLVLWQPGTKENNAEAMAPLMYDLRRVVQDTGCAILIVHHSRKNPGNHGDSIRGSSAILGAVDVALELIKEEEGRALLRTISRFGMNEDEALELDVSALTWRSYGSARDVQKIRTELQVLELLEERGALSPAQLIDQLEGGPSQASIYRLLPTMQERGLIDYEETSSRGRGRPTRKYFLTPNNSQEPIFSDDSESSGRINNSVSEQPKEASEEICYLFSPPGVVKDENNSGEGVYL